MELIEICNLASVVTDDTTITVVRGADEFVLDSNWDVVIEAPDGHPYELRHPWNAKDLIEFMARYPLDHLDCTVMFIYNIPEDSDTMCLVPDQFSIYLDNGSYDLQFNAL